MCSLIKKAPVVLLAALVAIQFFPPPRSVSTAAPGPTDFTVLYPASTEEAEYGVSLAHHFRSRINAQGGATSSRSP